MTYKIGAEVIIATPSTSFVQQYKGERGTITNFVEGELYPYEVQLPNRHGTLGFADSELAPAEYVDVVDAAIETLWAKVMEPVEDEVNHPSHYTWLPNGVEVIDITELLNFNLGNVVKYTLRAGRKHDEPLTDLRKAAWYINREIERLEASK
ncbi:DUF3310 domain-containing protein [Streptomyces sp. NBC_01751]|uniref:DUF3310 domain-containing protein n=1 Tax=Streptomyces sp. NBC_01751 TaxID=2975929 RepID=UPI002DDAD384|nr:DUF3310 domain-containing protein [Streptomyces sp. NBC_01751]WSD24526.1 DUF3310 domain-containing protein [Streptomyces sp. NBC_01751]